MTETQHKLTIGWKGELPLYITKTLQKCYWILALKGGHSDNQSTCQCRRHRRQGFNLWARKIPWRRTWLPTPVFLPIKFTDRGHGGLQSMWSQQIEQDWAHTCSQSACICSYVFPISSLCSLFLHELTSFFPTKRRLLSKGRDKVLQQFSPYFSSQMTPNTTRILFRLLIKETLSHSFHKLIYMPSLGREDSTPTLIIL